MIKRGGSINAQMLILGGMFCIKKGASTIQCSIKSAYKKNSNLMMSLIFLNLYFISQFFWGNNGWINYIKLINAKKYKSHMLNKIEVQNMEYEREIELISTEKLDMDYLDELARKRLNYSQEDEKVIIYKLNN